MKTNYFSKNVFHTCLLLFLLVPATVFSQVGIGTDNPDPSCVLELYSTTQGFLTTRITTAQRTAIVSPADGLLVYDTDLKLFYHYILSTATWSKLNSDVDGRVKFKRIKSTDVLATVLADEKTAGGGTKYLLDTGTFYEINGTISVDLPIELNNAYVAGIDSGEDKLVKSSGDLFTGTTGGFIKVLTLVASSGNIFNIIGTGDIVAGTQTQTLILRDCIVANSANVGKLENLALVFVSIVQYIGNTTGIVYKDISRVLLSNAAWFGTNAGTFESFQSRFGLIEKTGGFSEVPAGAIGIDVSTNPTITSDAVMEAVVFLGAGQYVNPYTVGTYSGYNFNDYWTVRSTGIPNEGDSYATGNFYLNRALTSPTIQLTTIGTNYKVPGTTIATNLYRMNGATTNRLVYLGRKVRTFTVLASLSFEAGSGATDIIFYFAKFGAGGTPITYITSSETFIDSNTSNVQSLSVSGTVSLANGEYIELYAQRLNGTNKTFTFRSYNMSMK